MTHTTHVYQQLYRCASILIVVWTLCIDGVAAQSDGISWTAVAISWVISTVTTIILIAAAFAIQRCCSSNNNPDASKNDSSDETVSEFRKNGGEARRRNHSIDSIEEALTPSAGNNVRKQLAAQSNVALRTGNRPVLETEPIVARQGALSPEPPASQDQRRSELAALRIERERRSNNSDAVATGDVRSPVVADSAMTVLRHQPVRISNSTQDGRSPQQPAAAADETRHSNRNRLRNSQDGAAPVAVSMVTATAVRESMQSEASVEHARQLKMAANQRSSAVLSPAAEEKSSSSGPRQVNPVMTFQPLSVAALMPPFAAVRTHTEPTRDQNPPRTVARRAPSPPRVNDDVEEEFAEPMRLAPRSEKHRQQQERRRDSYRRQVPLAEGEDLDDLTAAPSTATRRQPLPDAEISSSTSSLSNTSSSSGDAEQSENTESSTVVDQGPAAMSSPRLPHRPALPAPLFSPLTTPPAASSAVPMFTSRPAAPNSGLLRPEALRSARRSLKRRPASLDNALVADSPERSTDVWSTGLSQSRGDRDSRLSAWQRVQASMRSAHSEPIIVPGGRNGEASLSLVSGSPQPRPTSAKISTPPQVSDSRTSQQRLRQVVRDLSANPSPPVFHVPSSTPSNVAMVKAGSSDRRRRTRPDQNGEGSRGDPTRDLGWSRSDGMPKQKTPDESSSRKADKQSRRSSTGRNKTSSSAGGHRTGHHAPASRNFFSPGPKQTSTPAVSAGPSTPTSQSKRYKKHDDPRKSTERTATKAPMTESSANPAVTQFQGLLSDEGLRQMARHIGHDWNRLAAALRLPASLPSVGSATSTYEVLKDWRDNYPGDADRLRGRLCDALVSSRRADLAQKLIDEKTAIVSGSQDASSKLVTVV